jgi:hypothetical protein
MIRMRGVQGLYHTFTLSGKMEETVTMRGGRSIAGPKRARREDQTVKQLLAVPNTASLCSCPELSVSPAKADQDFIVSGSDLMTLSPKLV